jgi:hypothetical protein
MVGWARAVAHLTDEPATHELATRLQLPVAIRREFAHECRAARTTGPQRTLPRWAAHWTLVSSLFHPVPSSRVVGVSGFPLAPIPA